MGDGFLDRVEDNAAVRTWVEIAQREKGDSLVEGHVLELWDFTRVSVAQNNLQELKEIWDHWNNEDLILVHPDLGKRVDVLALSIYGLVVLPKTLGHVDEAVTDLFDRLDKRVSPVLVILAETFRSLNACRRAGEGRFIGCAQLLLAWFYSYFWKVDKVSYRVFSESYSPLKEIVATPRRDNISKEKLMAIFQNLQEEDIEWRAPRLLPDEVLYRCGDFDWVPLLGI
ncbi:hypothetical protein Goshw_008064 [Gossypium schwendimanii]|uniref:DUF7745 domain-containing protein n=2 Tax=Gossypium schwendimanii TaxID=34291 RepID=A0A7J9N7G9_GOSSC|nr:hypothetical protein [Gossypium schwendimanii]